MICSNCGCFITENNRKCWNCGVGDYEFSDQVERQKERPKECKPISRKKKVLLFGSILAITVLDLWLITKNTSPVREIQDMKIVQEVKGSQVAENESMNNIKSSYQLQNVYESNKQKLVVYAKNSSDKYFSGSLSFAAYDQNGQIVNNSYQNDIIFVNVPPNTEPAQSIWIERSRNVTLGDVRWSNIQFTDKTISK